MKKMHILALVIGLIAAAGCALTDTLGNGKIDPGGVTLVDLSELEVNVGWTDPDTGAVYAFTKSDEGIDIQYQWTDTKGFTYILGEGVGSFSIVSPDGVAVSVVPVGDDSDSDPPDETPDGSG